MIDTHLQFLNFLDPKHSLSKEDRAFLLSDIKTIECKKHEHLISTGDDITHVFFLLEGIVRYYINTEKGHEVTKAFYKDAFLIGSFDVIFNKIPNKFSVQSLTQTKFLKIPIENIRQLLENSHEFSKAYNHFITSIFIVKEKREIELLSTTAEERLTTFNSEFPEIADEISNVILASYLGISAIQLSRIKNKTI